MPLYAKNARESLFPFFSYDDVEYVDPPAQLCPTSLHLHDELNRRTSRIRHVIWYPNGNHGTNPSSVKRNGDARPFPSLSGVWSHTAANAAQRVILKEVTRAPEDLYASASVNALAARIYRIQTQYAESLCSSSCKQSDTESARQGRARLVRYLALLVDSPRRHEWLMEYCAGNSLFNCIAAPTGSIPLDEASVQAVGFAVVSALHFLHEDCAMVHGDVCLSNVLLTTPWQPSACASTLCPEWVKLGDLESVLHIGQLPEVFSGTLRYAAPEVLLADCEEMFGDDLAGLIPLPGKAWDMAEEDPSAAPHMNGSNHRERLEEGWDEVSGQPPIAAAHPSRDVWALGVLLFQLVAAHRLPSVAPEAGTLTPIQSKPLRQEWFLFPSWSPVVDSVAKSAPLDVWMLRDQMRAMRQWGELEWRELFAFHLTEANSSINRNKNAPPAICGDGADFIRRCLTWDWRVRPSTRELLDHPWLAKAGATKSP